MSTQSRLERLGLAHLADDEAALTQALHAMDAKFREQDEQAPPVVVAAALKPAPLKPQTAAPQTVQPAAQAKATAVAEAKSASPVDVAVLYSRIGGGARDRSGRAGGGRTTTRGAAPLITPEQFAARITQLGAQNESAAFLPRLTKLPEQMRILTLEALYGAQDAEEVRAIILQTEPMLQ